MDCVMGLVCCVVECVDELVSSGKEVYVCVCVCILCTICIVCVH